MAIRHAVKELLEKNSVKRPMKYIVKTGDTKRIFDQEC